MWRQCDYELRLVVIQYAKRSPLETFWAKRTTLRCGLQQAMPRPLRRFGVRRVLLSRREATFRFQLRQYPESLAGLLFAPHRRGISILTITFSRPTSHRQTLSGEMKEKLHNAIMGIAVPNGKILAWSCR
jgi:hypothetical protein